MRLEERNVFLSHSTESGRQDNKRRVGEITIPIRLLEGSTPIMEFRFEAVQIALCRVRFSFGRQEPDEIGHPII